MIDSIDHINIIVTDLEAMADFYSHVLELKITKRVTISGDWIDATVNLKDVRGEVIYLEAESGPRIELLKYHNPVAEERRASSPAKWGMANTAGIRHLAFRVSDIAQTVARLRNANIKFLSEIQKVPDAQVTYANGVRKRLVYFHDPENNLLELCEYRAE